MQIHFKGTNYILSPEMTAFAHKKIIPLRKYLGKVHPPAEVYVDLGRSGPHHTGPVWKADIHFEVNGKLFNAKAVAETLERAIDVAVAELSRELHTAKKRDESLLRQGGAAVKAFLRGFSV